MPVTASYRPDPQFQGMDGIFADPVAPADFPRTTLRWRNDRWAGDVGLDGLSDAEWVAHFGRFEPLPDNQPQPLALRYHGHQFQSYNPDLGDGRGFLFAQLRDNAGRLLDLFTKGSGQTPYSRAGDGRLTLKGGVREVLAASLLEARGVYTSKAFSLIETGEALQRHDEPSPTRSAVLVRLSHSHMRFGVFQRHAFHRDSEALAELVNHVGQHYLPQITTETDQAAALLRVACEESARLTAQWMAAGFVHGVLNTDNVTVTGESFDYGPYRFLPKFEPGFTAAYFDHSGLYAFARQPEAVFWNCRALAAALRSVSDEDALVAALEVFHPAYRLALRDAVFARLGLLTSEDFEGDMAFIQSMFTVLETAKLPWEPFFHRWFGGTARGTTPLPEEAAWAEQLAAYTPDRPERLSHPHFAGEACDLLYEEIEQIWSFIDESDDWSAFHAKLSQIEAMRIAMG